MSLFGIIMLEERAGNDNIKLFNSMNIILVLIAAGFFLAAIAVGTDLIKVKGEWASVAITYSLLAIGITFFGFGLTL